jgi:hypothetical protein
MNDELPKIGDNPTKELFAIFRLAFEKVKIFLLKNLIKIKYLFFRKDY